MKFYYLERGRWGALARMAVLVMLLMTSLGLSAQQLTVTGTVTSATDGEPLIGASVQVKGTAMTVITDFDGNYSIKADKGQQLQFTYVGFQSQTLPVDGNKLDVVMQEDNNVLDEVVVVGYGVQKKKLVTGATSQVKGADIAKMNTTNALQAMQGQTAGVNITQASGQPGKGMKVSIRGLGTIGNAEPLYLIDGVGGDINNVNPADIESIDVLKDAASAAIYGAQAANGVVLVTTKSGKEGRAVVSFDAYYGWHDKVRSVDMLNANEYMLIMDEMQVNSGNAPYDWQSMASIWDANGNAYDTNWVDEMFADNATTQSYTLGVSGGNTSGNYAISLAYMNNEGLIGGKDVSNFERYNFRVNSNYKMFENIITVGEHVSFIHYKTKNMNDQGNGYNGNRLYSAFGAAPMMPIYGENSIYGGPYFDSTYNDWNDGMGNPYGEMMLKSQLQNKNTLFNGDVYVQVDPFKGFTFKSLFAVSYSSYNYRSYTPKYSFSIYDQSDKSRVNQSAGDGFTITWQNTAAYNWNWGANEMNALLGMEVSRSNGFDIAGNNASLSPAFDSWQYAWLNNGTATGSDNGLNASGKPWDAVRNISYFARLGWNYDEKYMVNATLRADGSSKFAKGHRWGWFPSVSAGWNISNEAFMEGTRDWLSFLKIRASYGRVGNNNIACFQYASPIVYNGHYTFGQMQGASGDGYQLGAYSNRLANENVTWETSEQFDAGFDARFLDSRLEANFDFYIKNTKNWLVEVPLLSTAGVETQLINGGDVKNKGVEVNLTWRDKIGDFEYYIGGNFSYNQNRVGSIPTDDGIINGQGGSILYDSSDIFYRCENGHEIGYFWGYQTDGLFQNQAEIDQWIAAGNGVLQSNVKPGDVRFIDQNHDGRIDKDDKIDLGSGVPDWTYGFNLGGTYKHFDLGIVLSGMAGHKIVQAYRNNTNVKSNFTKAILNRWTGEGTSNSMPRLTSSIDNWIFSDLYLQDGDFLRISNITLGYDFAPLVNWKYLQKARLYFQVQNLHTFTKYNGMDPEVGYGNVSDKWVSGVDQGFYPRPRTWLVGVNLTF